MPSMASLADLQDERTKLVAARDRILEQGQQRGARGKTVTETSLQTIITRIEKIDSQISRLQTPGVVLTKHGRR